jgi:hypothetical protein
MKDRDFDSGVRNYNGYASNAQLAERQMKLIRPLLACTDEDYLSSLKALLVSGLGNRKL